MGGAVVTVQVDGSFHRSIVRVAQHRWLALASDKGRPGKASRCLRWSASLTLVRKNRCENSREKLPTRAFVDIADLDSFHFPVLLGIRVPVRLMRRVVGIVFRCDSMENRFRAEGGLRSARCGRDRVALSNNGWPVHFLGKSFVLPHGSLSRFGMSDSPGDSRQTCRKYAFQDGSSADVHAQYQPSLII